MSTLITQPQIITVTGKVLTISANMGVTKLSVYVKSGSAVVSGSGGFVQPAMYSSNNATIASTDPPFTFGGSVPIDGLVVDATSATCEVILSSN